MLEATRRFLRRPMQQIEDAWDAAEAVWEIDDPFLDGRGSESPPAGSIWD